MFDQFMERTLPLWLMITALLPIVIAAMLFKAAFRIRHLRSLLNDATRRAVQAGGMGPIPHSRMTESEDWVASP